MTNETATRQRVTNGAAPAVTEADLNLKGQVSVSLPMALIFKIEEVAEKTPQKDGSIKADTGPFIAQLVADHFHYELPKATRNRASMSDEEKKARAKAAAEEKRKKIEALRDRFSPVNKS